MSTSHNAHHSPFFESHRGGRLSDATNTFDPQRRSMKVPAENANGDFSQTYGNNDHHHRQQQYCNPAPYPPLPPAAPAAQNPAYQPLPPAPPLSWPSSCYNFSTPPGPAPAPYPPLPRTEAISPTSLNAIYSTGNAPAPAGHAFSRAAVELPLPAHAVAGLPQLVADYCSPVAPEAVARHRSVSPPPPPPPPPPPAPPAASVRNQVAVDYSSPVSAGAAQCGASPASPQPPPPPPRPPSMAASRDSSGGRRPDKKNWLPPPPPLQWWQGPSKPPEEAAAAPLPDPRKASDPRKTSGNRSSKRPGEQSGRGKDYVIPKKKDAGRSRAKDPSRTAPEKAGAVSVDEQKRHVYSPDTLRRYGDANRSSEASSSSSSSASSRRGDVGQSRQSNSSGSGRGSSSSSSGRRDDRVRWSEKEDGHKRRGGGGDSGNSRHGAGSGGRSSSGRGNQDEAERYRRRDRGEGADRSAGASGGRPYGRSREYEDGDARRGSRRSRWDERGDGRGKAVGKSCPPPSAEKRRNVSLVDLSSEGDDDELAELTSQLTALELEAGKGEKGPAAEGNSAAAATAGGSAKAYLSLEEYKDSAAKGEIKAYKGTKYQTVDARYADGWAYNPATRRWVKVACQEKKNAMEALPALLARLELMENKDKLATQRSQLLETKVEKITKEKETGRKTVSLAVPTAPILVAFDTNWLIHHLADTMCRVADIAGRHTDTSVLIPKEVLSELDRLKTRGKDQATRSSAQKANRYFRDLVERPLERGRKFPVVRVQEDTELFRDEGHHSRPEGLGGDDSILNCCMFFTQAIDTPRKVTLVTGDNNFAIRASAHGLMTVGRPQCDPGRCRMPLCPAAPRPSPFSRGY